MANETYQQALAAAKKRLDENLAEAAADVVVLAGRFDKPLKTVARDVTVDSPEVFQAVYSRCQRIQKARSATDSAAPISEPTEAQKGGIRGAKSAIRKHPEMAKDLVADPDVAQAVAQALNRAQAEQVGQRREQSAQRKSADPVGRKFDERVALHELQAEANKFVKVAVDLIPEIGLIPEAERFWLKGEAERLEYIAGELRYMAEHGETRTDSELRAITEAG